MLALRVLTLAAGAASYEAIFNYVPNSKVTDHNAIDLDQEAMETELGKRTDADMLVAKAIYEQGGHSKAYAEITGATAAAAAYTKSAGKCVATLADGTASGDMSLKSDVALGATTYQCLYPTTTVQATYQSCQVGGLPTSAQLVTGCINPALLITISEAGKTSTVIAAGTNPTITNKAGRTLQGFGTSGTQSAKMYTTSSSCPGCPYATYQKFYDYYGEHGYADAWVSAAIGATSKTWAATPSANYAKAADFATHSTHRTRTDAVKKGTAYMNAWMYVIREFEDAIDDCSTGSLNNNYGSVHAWDEGVAFWAGSLEGTDGSGGGKLFAALADKRCQNFATCGTAGTASTGTSKVNTDLVALFMRARNELIVLNCGAVRPILDSIIKKLQIPLIQGTLRYAYKQGAYGPAGDNSKPAGSTTLDKENAEGATFAHAVLPMVSACSPTAAQTIYNQMKIGGGESTSFSKDAVKAALEATYACLGVTCADIGALGEASAGDPFATRCTDASTAGQTTDVAYERIYGYLPRSKVTDHNAIDLDQAAMETELGKRTTAGFAAAKNIYTQGGNSKSYARFTVPGTDTAGTAVPLYAKGTAVTGMTSATATRAARAVTGTLKSAISASATTIDVVYDTNTVQANYNGGCQVGGLVSTTTTGCFNPTGTIVVGTTPINPTTAVNKAGRTLQGFATTGTVTSKMYTTSSSCPGCPYTTFVDFYNYYGDLDYADKWVLAALDGTALTYTSGKAADFATHSSFRTRTDAVKKGTAYMNVWMYVIREFEDAIDDCSTSSIDNNYGSAHAWDEGVAFWTGSLEGTDGSGGGKLIAALADKRCGNFATCGTAGTATTGTSKVNIELFALFAEAQNYLYNGQCSLVRPVLTQVIKKMAVPLLQGTLRYAYKVATFGPGGDNSYNADTRNKENAEGAIFAHAVLPMIHKLSVSAATTIYTNMKIGEFSPNKAAVKSAIESVLPGLGLSCTDIGALTTGGGLATSSDPFGVACTDPASPALPPVPPLPPPLPSPSPPPPSPSPPPLPVAAAAPTSTGPIIGIIIAGVVAVLFALIICYMYCQEKAGKPVFSTLSDAKTTA